MFSVPFFWQRCDRHLVLSKLALLTGPWGCGLSHHFVLSDFENVQFKEIGTLKPGECRIKLFIGQSQTKLSVELVEALQPFGAEAEIIRISGNGPNALDFHIAFYLGRLAAEFPGSHFSIISRDTGFDPLITHLASQGIGCVRLARVPAAATPVTAPAERQAAVATKAASAPKKAAAKKVVVAVQSAGQAKPVATPAQANTKTRAAEVLRRLAGMSKPTKVTTLQSSIKSFFKPALNDKQVASVVQSLADSRKIVIDGTKVIYPPAGLATA